MQYSLSGKLLGIWLGILFVLAACSGSAIPEIDQDISFQAEQQGESELLADVPTEVVGVNQPTPEEINHNQAGDSTVGSGENENSSIQENQSTSNSDPQQAGSPEGYPAAEPDNPAPTEGLSTPTLMPAYPAPSEGTGSPSTDSANPPTLKTGLEATEPATVKLASGGLQFVEFFAFW